jgi:hypothetical protein
MSGAGGTNQELLKKVSSNVLSFFNTPTTTPEIEETSAEDIPKDEMMALLMKMNKRMQVMESKTSLLTKRTKCLLAERRGLLDLLQQNVPSLSVLSAEDDQDVDVQLVTDVWAEHNRGRAERADETLKQALAAVEERCRTEVSNMAKTRVYKSVEELANAEDLSGTEGIGNAQLLAETDMLNSDKQVRVSYSYQFCITINPLLLVTSRSIICSKCEDTGSQRGG